MKKVLVYPCGTEIGMEVYKAVHNSIHYEVWGGSCSYDHGRFVFENHIDNLAFITDRSDEKEIAEFNEQIKEYGFDYIYPAMDGVLSVFAKYQNCLEPVVIAPEEFTAAVTRSKKLTYETFEGILPVPKMYESIEDITEFPVFRKPDVGQGSAGTMKIHDKDELLANKKEGDGMLLLEYLPGKEYTIDCFTNGAGELLFAQGRERKRIRNGISVNAVLVNRPEFMDYAKRINEKLHQKGGWFFQLKEDANGELKLLEIASRIAGTSAIERCIGANLPLLTLDVYRGLNIDSLALNTYEIELDRALVNSYRLELDYNTVYVDYDDTVHMGDQLNLFVIQFLYQCVNTGKKLILLTKHEGDLEAQLKHFRIGQLFDEIIHIEQNHKKIDYINPQGAIFIDDSYGERAQVKEKYNIPVFDVSMLEALVK